MPLLWLSSAFLCGIVLGELLGWSLQTWLILAFLALAAYFLLRLPRLAQPFSRIIAHLPPSPIPYLLLLVALAIGAARCQSAQPKITPSSVAWYNDLAAFYTIDGVLIAPPDQRDTVTFLRLQVEQIRLADEALFMPVEGLLQVTAPRDGDWQYGDRLRIQGALQTPPEDETFSYRDHLARQGILSILRCESQEKCIQVLQRKQGNPILSFICTMQRRGVQTIYRLLPDPEASLLAGILLGVETGIPDHVQDAFRVTGTAHIIAISGANFAVVAEVFTRLFRRLCGKWRGAWAALLSILVYTLLVGGGAGVTRAAIMSGYSLIGTLLGRQSHGPTSLAFVAALMALDDPNVLWDVSFQLSFAATLGLVLYGETFIQAFLRFAARRLPPDRLPVPSNPPLANSVSPDTLSPNSQSAIRKSSLAQRLAGPVGDYFLLTLAAQLTTLPITIFHFRQLSLISLVANPLILPAQPPVMILGGLAAALGSVFLPLGQVFAYLVWPFLIYTIRAVELLAQSPVAALPLGQVSLPLVVLFYGLLLAQNVAGTQIKTWFAAHFGALLSPLFSASLLALTALSIMIWQMVFTAPDGRLHLTVLDVGSGDALLIQTPTGRYMLVDGGPSPGRLSDGLGRRLPILHRRLDYLVVATTNDDQVAALSGALERFPPANVLWSEPPPEGYETQEAWQYLVDAKIPVATVQAGQSLDLGQGARLSVLTANSSGAVLLLEWDHFRALLPVGMDTQSLNALQQDRRLGPVTALLLAGSGAAALNPPEWIARWQPQVILLSVKAGDEPETLQAIQGYTLLRTDQNGWLHLSTDGQNLCIETER